MTPMVRPPPPASHGLSMAAVGTDFAAFFGSYFSGRAEISDSSQTGCGIYEAVLLQWIRQAQILATHIGKLAGARTSVHMLTTCLNPQVGTVLSRPGGAPVTIHPGHNLELRRIVGQLEAHQKKPCPRPHKRLRRPSPTAAPTCLPRWWSADGGRASRP